MAKPRLTKVIVVTCVSVTIFVAVGLGTIPTAHSVEAAPTPMLIMSPDTTPSLGSSGSDSVGAVMVYVPSGCFVMGQDDTADDIYSGGAPFRMCFSQGYWIDETVVSNAAYQKFIDAGGYKQQGTWWRDAGWSWLHSMNIQRPYDYTDFTDPLQPRVGVMWYEADAYCRWRDARLPTEPEWEYAARGPDSLIFPWGNVFDPLKVVYAANSASRPAPVGSKPDGASWVGALDMSGNVLQWTSTAYEEYDPTQKLMKTYRYPYPARNDGRESATVDNQTMVVRGSSWDESNPDHLRTGIRHVAIPDQEYYRQINVSFRCIRP